MGLPAPSRSSAAASRSPPPPPPTEARCTSLPAMRTRITIRRSPVPPPPCTSSTLVPYYLAAYRPVSVRETSRKSPTSTSTTTTTPTCVTAREQTHRSACPTSSPSGRSDSERYL